MEIIDNFFGEGEDDQKSMKQMNPFYFFDKFAETKAGGYVMLLARYLTI
jgi:hypothetical protein